MPFRVADFDAIAASGLIAPGYTTNIPAGWDVGEETMGAYVEMNSEYYFGDMRLRSNVGLRYVKTNVTSSAIISGKNVEDKSSYDNYLPSINLALDVTKDVVFRALLWS